MKRFELIPIDENGRPGRPLGILPEMCKQNCEASASFYRAAVFEPPWIGYVSVSEGRVVGGGGFKGPPGNNRVEIAYYTLPDAEGRGFATATAWELIQIAQRAAARIRITAQTLPVDNASNSVLKKLGFALAGTASDSEVGEVWEWQLNPQATVPPDAAELRRQPQ